MDDEQDTNPIPEDQPPPADESRADEQASDAEALDALTQGSEATDLAADEQRLKEMVGAAEEPPPAPAESAPEVHNKPLGEEPERPDVTAHDYETDAKTLDDLAGERDIESFGAQVNAFNEAGGADNSIPNIGDDDGGGEGDAQQQLNDADFNFKSKVSDMLIEQSRRIDELTRSLEAERI